MKLLCCHLRQLRDSWQRDSCHVNSACQSKAGFEPEARILYRTTATSITCKDNLKKGRPHPSSFRPFALVESFLVAKISQTLESAMWPEGARRAGAVVVQQAAKSRRRDPERRDPSAVDQSLLPENFVRIRQENHAVNLCVHHPLYSLSMRHSDSKERR